MNVEGDQTSGGAAITISGTGTPAPTPLFSRSGTGSAVFNMPQPVSSLHIVGRYYGSSENFAVWVGGQLIVNEILGTFSGAIPPLLQVFDRNVVTGGGVTVSINGGNSSNGVSWSVVENR